MTDIGARSMTRMEWLTWQVQQNPLAWAALAVVALIVLGFTGYIGAPLLDLLINTAPTTQPT